MSDARRPMDAHRMWNWVFQGFEGMANMITDLDAGEIPPAPENIRRFRRDLDRLNEISSHWQENDERSEPTPDSA